MAELDDLSSAPPLTGGRTPVNCADLPSKHEPAPHHALPFACIFDELWARRADELRRQIQLVFAEALGRERELLDEKIAASTAAYALLQQSKLGHSYGELDEQRCYDADRDLLKLLHRMNTSALCLSGGGIRSASYCLGTLQGLARFGFSSIAPRDSGSPHLLSELDYLSTVSGGGYLGSWLMAWTKR